MKEEKVTGVFQNVQLRFDTNLQIAVPLTSEKYDFFEVYKPGIGASIIVRKIGYFHHNKLEYLNKGNSFYESRKNLSGVLLRTANTVDTLAYSLTVFLLVLNAGELFFGRTRRVYENVASP